MTRAEYIEKAEAARKSALTERWNLWMEHPRSSVAGCKFCELSWCLNCVLSDDEHGCCGGLFNAFANERNLKKKKALAAKIYDYIENADIEAFADKLVKEGVLEG
jgi:hypothetical protein